jgi:hypothetical protein
MDRSEDEIAVYDELLARFADAPEPALREQVAKALFNKGIRLGQLDRSDDEIAVYDELPARFVDAPEPAIGEVVEVARKVRRDASRRWSLIAQRLSIDLHDQLRPGPVERLALQLLDRLAAGQAASPWDSP